MINLDNLTILLVVILIGMAMFLLSSCLLKCGGGITEGYWTLPFGGGAVITDVPDPQRIEGPVGRVMDETDMNDGGYPL